MAKMTGVRRRCTKECSPRCRRHKFEYQVELPAGADGRRRQISQGGFRTAEEAADARAAVIRAHRSGTLPSDDRRRQETVAEFLMRWLQVKEASGDLRASTVLSYRGHLDRYLIPHLGQLKIRDLRRDHIEAMFAAVRKQTAANVRPVGPSTERRILATLRSAVRDAVRAGELPHDHTTHVRLPKVVRPRGHWWDADSYWQFVRELEAAPGGSAAARLLPIVQVAAGTGLRLGEVCGLRWQDVDIARGHLVVRQQAQQVGQQINYVRPKTRAGEERIVPLAGWVPSTLETWRRRQAAERLALGPDYVVTDLVFTHPDGHGLMPHSVSKCFARLVAANDLPPCRFHDLRHLAATVLLTSGVPMPVVSRILGHSSIAITVDTYGHIAVDPQVWEAIHRALSGFAGSATSH